MARRERKQLSEEALRLLQAGRCKGITDAAWELVMAGRAVLRVDCSVGAPLVFQVLTPQQARGAL